MKKILIIALTLIAFTAAHAQSPAIKEVSKAAISVQVSDHTTQTPVAAPCEEQEAPAAPTAGNAPDVSANYVGTNDLNLLLLRQGIKRA
ncbi:MAG: hypothetical protein JWO03_3310 [Bacteroidetes bacterium]|nr:hypothetical protein [Bacteroidota bacterium]